MEKNEEIKKIREEITRLRIRLNELDGDESNEPVTEVCGHDYVLEHLKKFGKQYNQPGRCVLAGYYNNYWYTSTIEPTKINAFLEDSHTVRKFLTLFCNEKTWSALVSIFHNRIEEIDQDTYKILEENKLVSEDSKLTTNGFTCYAVLGHLSFNMTKKLSPEKAIPIFGVVYEITGIEFGEQLPYKENEFLEMVKNHEKYNGLIEEGITEKDIAEYLRQMNI